MSTDPYARRAPLDLSLLREVAALVFVLAGAAGLVTAAFMVSPALGVATVSAVVLAAGVVLGLDR